MSEKEVNVGLNYQKPGGGQFTRIEMENQLRDTWKKLHTKRRRAGHDFGLSKNNAFGWTPGVLTHWMLDEMIRRKLIQGQLLGVDVGLTYLPGSSELTQLTQRLQALVESKQALPPTQGEGFDMNGQQMPPPPGAPNGYAPPPP